MPHAATVRRDLHCAARLDKRRRGGQAKQNRKHSKASPRRRLPGFEFLFKSTRIRSAARGASEESQSSESSPRHHLLPPRNGRELCDRRLLPSNGKQTPGTQQTARYARKKGKWHKPTLHPPHAVVAGGPVDAMQERPGPSGGGAHR